MHFFSFTSSPFNAVCQKLSLLGWSSLKNSIRYSFVFFLVPKTLQFLFFYQPNVQNKLGVKEDSTLWQVFNLKNKNNFLADTRQRNVSAEQGLLQSFLPYFLSLFFGGASQELFSWGIRFQIWSLSGHYGKPMVLSTRL